MARYLYSELASAIQAYHNCLKSGNTEWQHKHEEWIDTLVDLLPSGSGIDCGTKIDLDRSHGEKIVLIAEYHHMNDGGYYDGWTYHTITVTPSFMGNLNLRISGRNRNYIKDYLYETYDWALRRDVEWEWMLQNPKVRDMGIKLTYQYPTNENPHAYIIMTVNGVHHSTNLDWDMARAAAVAYAKSKL